MNSSKATTTEPETQTAPIAAPASLLSGVQLFASRYKQGGRTVYSLDLSPAEIIATIEKPDENTPTPGNRAIRIAHAIGFGKYLRERDDWVSPSLMLRAPDTFELDVKFEGDGIQFGVLTIPRRSLADLRIVDGQHRIYGMFAAEKGIAEDLDKARSMLALARRNEGRGSAAEAEALNRISDLEKQRDRLEGQRISVQVIVESDPVAYKQMFFDIADNALGITASVKSRFDNRKVVNRSLDGTIEHPLLSERVDPEGDRIGRGSIYLLGAKHVAEIIRTVNVGLDGRVSKRQEAEWKEDRLIAKTKEFLDMIVSAFPPLAAVQFGQLSPDALRKTSLLGSVLFLRVLAGAYFELTNDHHWTPEMVEAYFEKLAPHVTAPVYPGSVWMRELPGAFSDGSTAPSGRRQDLKRTKDFVVTSALDKADWLDQEPAPRPVPEVEEVDPEIGSGYTKHGADIPAS